MPTAAAKQYVRKRQYLSTLEDDIVAFVIELATLHKIGHPLEPT